MNELILKVIDQISSIFVGVISSFNGNLTNSFHYYWLVSFFVVSLFVFRFNKERIRSGLSFIFSRSFYLEFKKDLFFWFVFLLVQPIFAFLFFDQLSSLIGIHSYPHGDQSLVDVKSVSGVILVSVVTFVLMDFISFYTHYLQHRVKWFWYFHMTHHFALVLTPLTKYRIHPLEVAHNIFFPFMLEIPLIIYFFNVFDLQNSSLAMATSFTLNCTLRYFLLHFRHSHIKIQFGVLSHLLVSPHMHQAHHSRDKAHHNKNIGVIFSFWDKMFGTLYIPRKDEDFIFGIKGHEKLLENRSYFFEMKLPFILITRDIKIFLRSISNKDSKIMDSEKTPVKKAS